VYIYPAVGLSWSIREASELWNDLTGMEKGGFVKVCNCKCVSSTDYIAVHFTFMGPCIVNVFKHNQQDATLYNSIYYYKCLSIYSNKYHCITLHLVGCA